MSDIIRREDAVNALSSCKGLTPVARLEAVNEIMRVPVIDARPAKQGRWIYDCERIGPGGFRYSQYHCSECGGQRAGKARFCEFCGADMREENHDNQR